MSTPEILQDQALYAFRDIGSRDATFVAIVCLVECHVLSIRMFAQSYVSNHPMPSGGCLEQRQDSLDLKKNISVATKRASCR